MIRSFTLGTTALRLMVTAAVLAACPAADAQVKPFKMGGAGPAPEGLSIAGEVGPHGATGNATLMGKYTGDRGRFQALSFDPNTLTGTFQGSFVFEGANGDDLAVTYGDKDNGAAEDGVFRVVPLLPLSPTTAVVVVVFDAEFNPITDESEGIEDWMVGESTGRFKDVVAGSFRVLAATGPFVLDFTSTVTPPFNYAWAGEGWLEFAKKNKKK